MTTPDQQLLNALPLPLLVTGVAGVAGYNALHYFQARYPGQVIGLRQSDNAKLFGPQIVACDAEDRTRLSRLFDQYGFRSVLNCAGNCALRACELDPALAWRINVEGVRNLLHASRGHDARLVHLSIDLVFSGLQAGAYSEDDRPDPVTVYGRTMLAAERLIQHRWPSACILRISLPMGISFNGHAGAIDWIGARFRCRRPATLYFDEVRTPTYVDCLNELCETLLTNDLAGVYHAGSPQPLSLYQIAQIVNRVGGFRPQDLHGCLRHKAGPIPPRAGDVALNSGKLRLALGYEPFHPWPSEPTWLPAHDRWHYERPQDEERGPRMLYELLYCNPRRKRWYQPDAPHLRQYLAASQVGGVA